MKKLTRIEQLKNIKHKIEHLQFKSGEQLKQNIEQLSACFWGVQQTLVNDDLFNIDLSGLVMFHNYLIEGVKLVLNQKISEHNLNLITNSCSMRKIINRAEHGKQANKIYLFNENIEYVIIGDLHSDSVSLQRALKVVDFYNKVVANKRINLIFTGDYVDRGHEHLKLMEEVLILKFLFPNRVYLLRGNHDGGSIDEADQLTLPYRIPKKDSLDMYFPHYLLHLSTSNTTFNRQLLDQYFSLFNDLPYIAIIKSSDKVIMAVHGGIPRPNYNSEDSYSYLSNISDLTNNKITDFIGSTICNNLIWSDPYREEREIRINSRRFHFTKQEFNSFRSKMDFDLLVRGHESADDGYRYHFDDTALTIFSSGGIHENEVINPKSAYSSVEPKVLVVRNGDIFFK